MAGTAISIDRAASGLLRHRFVRAMGSSSLVFCALLIGWLFWATFQLEYLDLSGWFIAVALVGPILLILFSSAVAILVSALAFVHRRLTALALFAVSTVILIIIGAAALGFIQTALGLKADIVGPGRGPIEKWATVAVLLLTAAIAFEGVGWAFWQIIIDRDEFLAARGWRPPPWRIYSVTRQALGMPGFISSFGRGRASLTFLYFVIATLNLGLIAVFLMAFNSQFLLDLSYSLAWILPWAALLALNALGLGAFLQRMAARRATKLYQQVREWDARPPIVFLRSFDQDAAKLQARAFDPLVRFPAGCGEARTLDELLIEHASVYGPVIAIGDPREPTPPLGAARVFVPGENNEWRDVVHSLLQASKAVVMCPSTTAGVQWELDLIAEALGRLRVIFLANPNLSREETVALFRRFVPTDEVPEVTSDAMPIAAYLSQQGDWRVLTAKLSPCVQTYTVALNYALQDMFGMAGEQLAKPKRKTRRAA